MERVVNSTTENNSNLRTSLPKNDRESGNETTEAPENISNRLEMLSSAFDAIQKYLEEQLISSSGQQINNNPTTSGILLKEGFNR